MKLFLGFILIFYVIGYSTSGVSFRYEKLHNFGIGRRVIPNYRLSLSNSKYAFPEPLPSPKPHKIAMIREPYRRIHQGYRRRNMDKRVYRKVFDFPPIDIDQRIKCESLMNCTVDSQGTNERITYISVDTEEGLPIIFRGGAGYRHFTVLVRANPGDAMKGTISVFCNKSIDSDENE